MHGTLTWCTGRDCSKMSPPPLYLCYCISKDINFPVKLLEIDLYPLLLSVVSCHKDVKVSKGAPRLRLGLLRVVLLLCM